MLEATRCCRSAGLRRPYSLIWITGQCYLALPLDSSPAVLLPRPRRAPPRAQPPKTGGRVSNWAPIHPTSAWHPHSLPPLALARARPKGPASAGPAGACPGFLLFVFGVFGSFRRTLRPRGRSRSIHHGFCSGHAPPAPRPKNVSSPLSHLGRSTPAARPAGHLALGPVYKYF